MDVTGIFITKIPKEQGLATIEQFCQNMSTKRQRMTHKKDKYSKHIVENL